MFGFFTCIIATVIFVSVKCLMKPDIVLHAIIFYTYCYLKVEACFNSEEK